MNKWLGIGVITSKIILKRTRHNRDIAKFRIAVLRSPTKESTTTYDIISCCAFDECALNCHSKGNIGDKVGIVGKISTIPHVFNGRSTIHMEIMIDHIEFLEEPIDFKAEEDSLIKAYYNSFPNNKET